MFKKMKWIGLTGNIGTGKSTVAALFKQKGVPTVDADEIARLVVSPGRPGLTAVVHSFGHQILNSDGTLNRSKLGQIVFNDKEKLILLESILHPAIQKEVQSIRQDLKNKGYSFAVYDVPLLFEKKMETLFDKIILVTCDSESQKERIARRDKITEQEIQSRINSQLPLSEKIPKSDYVIDNSSSFENLQKNFQKVFEQLQSEK